MGFDVVIHLIPGIALLFFPDVIIDALGIPVPGTRFYASVLGAMLSGIGLALLAERFRKTLGIAGLGQGGSICVKICTGGVLSAWLVHGDLPIPVQGYAILGLIAFALLMLSGAQFWVQIRHSHDSRGTVPE